MTFALGLQRTRTRLIRQDTDLQNMCYKSEITVLALSAITNSHNALTIKPTCDIKTHPYQNGMWASERNQLHDRRLHL